MTTALLERRKPKEIFFQENGLTIINGDILTTNAIPSSSIDLIITSPPYNVDISYNSHNVCAS